MADINTLLSQRDNLLKIIRHIEESCEGIDNENNSRKLNSLNIEKAGLVSNKSRLENELAEIEKQINIVDIEIRNISTKGLDNIVQAIKKQRWYFFKNKPKVFLDRDSGYLWPNLDYPDIPEHIGPFDDFMLEGFTPWGLPSIEEIMNLVGDKTFPFGKGGQHYLIKYKGESKLKVAIIPQSTNNANAIWLDQDYPKPCSDYDLLILTCKSLQANNYAENIAPNNNVYTENERLQFTLNLFINNGLEPIFKEEKVTTLYKKIFIDKPKLINELNELQEQIDNLQKNVLLSSTFDYSSVLFEYNVRAIDSSIIKYHTAVVSVINDLMDKLHFYEEVKSETIRDSNVIALKLAKKYEDNPNLTDAENMLFNSRQIFMKKQFKLGMNDVNAQLLAIKRQAEDIENRIDIINSGENAIRELAGLEREERASFQFIVENAVNIIKKALLKMEFFEAHKKFAINAVKICNDWNEDYRVFKTTLKNDLQNICEDDSIESEIYSLWYADWQKKRFSVEERFLPLIEHGLKGSLVDVSEDEPTVIEKSMAILLEYKDGIDRFYLEERKNIYQKFAFQAGADLQEKFETESELYKLIIKFQYDIQSIILSVEKAEDKLFLLKWANVLLDLQVDEVLDFIRDKELSKISLDILTEFADLKRKTFEVYISDSKAYSEELQRREKEYNSLIFKMRKDLQK